MSLPCHDQSLLLISLNVDSATVGNNKILRFMVTIKFFTGIVLVTLQELPVEFAWKIFKLQ